MGHVLPTLEVKHGWQGRSCFLVWIATNCGRASVNDGRLPRFQAFERRHDAASSPHWEAWIHTIEPLEFTPDEAARFDAEIRRYKLEAVRRHMQEESVPRGDIFPTRASPRVS